VLCAVAEEAQGRGAYVVAARALRAALAPRRAPQPRAPPTPGSESDEPASRRGGDDDEDALSGDSGEDYDSGGDDAADGGGATASASSGVPRLRVAHIPLAFLPLGRAALVLPPGSAAAEAPLATPGAPHPRLCTRTHAVRTHEKP
jgi:hypothetical protein